MSHLTQAAIPCRMNLDEDCTCRPEWIFKPCQVILRISGVGPLLR